MSHVCPGVRGVPHERQAVPSARGLWFLSQGLVVLSSRSSTELAWGGYGGSRCVTVGSCPVQICGAAKVGGVPSCHHLSQKGHPEAWPLPDSAQ